MKTDEITAFFRRAWGTLRQLAGLPRLPGRHTQTETPLESLRRSMINLTAEGYWIGRGTCPHCKTTSYLAAWPENAGRFGECSRCRRITNRPGTAEPVDLSKPLE